jgi:hypothetical protein
MYFDDAHAEPRYQHVPVEGDFETVAEFEYYKKYAECWQIGM